MLTVAITGSLAAGKSTVAAMFARLGCPVFDADAAVHALYRSCAALAAEVQNRFPGVTADGRIDRRKLARHVLNDAKALQELEALVHPRVAVSRARFLRQAQAAGASVAVLEIPLLFETGGEAEVDRVVTVSASEAIRRTRALARPDMTEAKWAGILARQMSDAEKRARADYVVDTGAGPEETFAQVRAILQTLGEQPSIGPYD